MATVTTTTVPCACCDSELCPYVSPCCTGYPWPDTITGVVSDKTGTAACLPASFTWTKLAAGFYESDYAGFSYFLSCTSAGWVFSGPVSPGGSCLLQISETYAAVPASCCVGFTATLAFHLAFNNVPVNVPGDLGTTGTFDLTFDF